MSYGAGRATSYPSYVSNSEERMAGIAAPEEEGWSRVVPVHSGWHRAPRGGRDDPESIGGVMEHR